MRGERDWGGKKENYSEGYSKLRKEKRGGRKLGCEGGEKIFAIFTFKKTLAKGAKTSRRT